MILDGKEVAGKIYEDIKNKINTLEKKPGLGVILVGNSPASLSYISQKEKWAKYVGLNFYLTKLNEDISQDKLEKEIIKFNEDKKISGFIVQLPLPKHINEQKIINLINPAKDVDGFTKENIGKLFLGDNSGLISCTPKGIKRLLEQYNISLVGKNVVIIGRSNIVGKPLSMLFINEGATVTVCNSKTRNIKEYTIIADIVVSAVGKPNIVTKDMINPGSIIIDVGFNKINGKIMGDCDFESLQGENYITPVPGGVGPMTVAMLIENTYLAFLRN
ncbi:bifunctional 5,10-methylenetetrahydrofolate dehydrogenase/5,10-methenyltetrahydrofolate cyclohydrolase [Candidatus Gracilibacteria bacterium]|nr:bifunctional 5,10-methylenetetrahydrofolate dehydrogenase/5,10-methenyltetrahydrofolate cyclohydrolase [Candidatus Gracilibacteria bacterium]